MARLLAPFVLLLAGLGAVAWIDQSPPPAEFTFVNQNEVFTLDPQRMSYIQDLRIAHALYEGLLRWNTDTFEVEPAVADLPACSPDQRTLTFRLRTDALWSNGEPVTAHDFVYAWRRAIFPDTAADYSGFFFRIEGARAFFEYRARQLAAFTSDPWRDPDSATPAATLLAVDRLEGLISASDLLSPSIARPPADRARRLREGLERLRQAANSGQRATLAAELRLQNELRTWHEELQGPESRRAEAMRLWNHAERRFAETVGIRAKDDHTLEVRLERPTPYFLDLLCFGVFFPVHRPTVEGWPRRGSFQPWHTAEPPPLEARRWIRLNPESGRLEQRHGWARPGIHVGNGPYRLERWRYKRDLRLERNELYVGSISARAASIAVTFIADTNTAVLAFESGRIDWLVDAGVEYQADMLAQKQRYIRRHREEIERRRALGEPFDAILASLPAPDPGERRNIHARPAFGLDFYSFNCRPRLPDGRANPFADPRVRRAFALAVDRRELTEQVNRLGEPPLTTLVPPGSIPGYEPPEGLGFDPVRARHELAAAGWEDRTGNGLVTDAQGRPFPVVDLLYTTNIPRWKWMSLALARQWESRLGVRVQLRPIETKFYKEDLKQGRFMIARGRWYGDYGDPTTFLELNRSTDGNNDRGFVNPRIDALLDEADREVDPQERFRILRECESILMTEEVPMVPICQLVTLYMYEPGVVTGLSDHPRMTQYLWRVGREPAP